MIIPTTTNKIESFGVSNAQTFRMQQSRKAFSILSDLYSDKPLAIVRELSANALDSMKMAKKGDVPFHIHIPNSLEPWLTIEDYGTGIADEDIYNIYSVYFASTKSETNDQIGCLGLGSKSPFCYTDNFTITSIHNGIKSIYSAFFNEQNFPTIAKMHSENTDEGNGVAIQIPIKESDFYLFANAIKKACRFFSVKPIISGGAITWDDDKIIFSGEDWKIIQGLRDSYAVMGGVAYPINPYSFETQYSNLLYKGVIMFFEMGEVDFVPSREALSYCDMTKSAICNKILSIKKEIVDGYTKKIAEKSSLFEALMTVQYFSNYCNFVDLSRYDITYNNEVITYPSNFVSNKLAKLGGKIVKIEKSYYRRKKVSVSHSIDISLFSKEHPIFVDDLKRGSENRAKKAVSDKTYECLYLMNKAAFDYFKSIGADFEYKMASELPKLNAYSAKTSTSKNVSFYRLGDSYKKSWDSVEFDSSTYDDNHKYYLVKNTDSCDPFPLKVGNISVYDKSTFIKLLDYLELDRNDVIMVSKRNLDNVVDALEVTPFIEYLEDVEIDFTVSDQQISDYQKYASHFSYYESLMGELSKFTDGETYKFLETINKNILHILEIKHNNFLDKNYIHEIANHKTSVPPTSYSHLAEEIRLFIDNTYCFSIPYSTARIFQKIVEKYDKKVLTESLDCAML